MVLNIRIVRMNDSDRKSLRNMVCEKVLSVEHLRCPGSQVILIFPPFSDAQTSPISIVS